METLFWILFAIVAYTYVGYAIILFVIIQIKSLFVRKNIPIPQVDYYPEVCLFITAYNEIDYVDQKIQNSLSLNYPKEKIQYLWITDGSNDGTPQKLEQYRQMEVHHLPERKGKMHAMNRGMKFVRTSIVIFSDCNTLLGENSILEIVNEFSNEKVGCVAGEKRIVDHITDDAAGAGEGIYWKYESWIKKMDSDLYSAVGAVGELFAIRKELFEEVETDTLLDDFIISLRIAAKGYKVSYVSNAYAIETASASVSEELKRKTRIAAGGIQAFLRLKHLLNPYKFGILSFQFFSHKILRWTLAPISLFGLLIINFLIVLLNSTHRRTDFFNAFLAIQLVMYLIAVLGALLEHRRIRFKILFVPYYFASMNYASIAGWWRFMRGRQSVNWEKAKRA